MNNILRWLTEHAVMMVISLLSGVYLLACWLLPEVDEMDGDE